ncbi:MAG: isocitrate/isopropylmalate dehydrogenase family protein [Candidatus Omnitrophota bacterium]|nr:isocitrate/isopropylmalate dehydrogenase family protein [Candidatus Omnitrophota bacterium]
MGHKVTLLPGDGIGPEVTAAMRQCVDATGVKIDWEIHQVGEFAIKEHGTPMPAHVIESIRKNKVAIKGPIVTPIGTGFRSVNVLLRQELDLYACVRPTKYYEGTQAKTDKLDIVIFRENTEDLYAGIEFEKESSECLQLLALINKLQPKKLSRDVGISIKPISVKGTRRLIKAACEYAVKNNRQKVTIVHKANIMKYTDGLFLSEGLDVAKDYEDKLIVRDCIVDNLCMQLVQRPQHFDILACPNLYGDIVSDLCAGLVGGLGIAPGANIGDQYALFEPVHGSAPKYAGLNKCNPTATILSAVLMLQYLNEMDAAHRLEAAVKAVLKEGKHVTYDLKTNRDDPSAASTTQMADAICAKL